MSFKISAVSVPGKKDGLNEDAFAVREYNGRTWCAIFDGTTSLQPIAELAAKGISGAHFASHFIRDQFLSLPHLESPGQVIRTLNEILLAYSKSHFRADLSDTHTLPASLATIIELDEKTLRLGHVGDAFVLLEFTDGTIEFITPNSNRPYDEGMLRLIEARAKEEGVKINQVRSLPDVQQAFIDMFRRRNNHPSGKGAGLVNGDPSMEMYLIESGHSLTNVASVLMGSDGLVPPGWDIEDAKDQSRILAEVKKGGLEGMIALKKRIEDEDPDWSIVRFKHSDDATGVFIVLPSSKQ